MKKVTKTSVFWGVVFYTLYSLLKTGFKFRDGYEYLKYRATEVFSFKDLK